MTEILWAQIIIGLSTLLAAVLGYVLAGLNEARRDRRAIERERAARDEDRHAAAINSRHVFQLETLLALQDALQVMARLTGRAMHFDHMQAREGRYTQLPDDLSDDMHANGVDVNRLRTRILDPELRAAVDNFHTETIKATLDPGRYQGLHGEELETRAFAVAGDFATAVRRVMDQVGTALRAELDWRPDR